MDTGHRPVPPVTPSYTHAQKMRVISGILLCLLLAAIDQTVVLPAIPQMAESLPGTESLSWVVSAYLLTSTAATPIYGKLSDQFGRRPVLIPAIVFFVLASIFCAMSHSVGMLIVGRALQGIGGGGLISVAQAAVADVIPPRERGKYQGWFAGTWGLASTAGPVAGGFVAQHLTWRWIFWINIPLGLLALFLCLRGLAIIPKVGIRSRVDYTGAALLTLSVSTFLFGLSSGGVDAPWLSTLILGAFAVSAVLLATLIVQQKMAAEPLFPGKLMTAPGYFGTLMVSFFIAASMFGGTFTLPLFLQGIFHQLPAKSGLEIVPFMATNSIAAFAAGIVCKKTGKPGPPLLFGLLTCAAGFAVLALLPQDAAIWMIVLAAAVAGIGIGAVMPTTLVVAQNQAPHGNVGLATSMLLLLRAMGGAFGATVVGVMFDAGRGKASIGGFHFAFLACCLSAALGAAVAFRLLNVKLRNTLQAEPVAHE